MASKRKRSREIIKSALEHSNCMEYYEMFETQRIFDDNIPDMHRDDLKELIPNMGHRLDFSKAYKQLTSLDEEAPQCPPPLKRRRLNNVNSTNQSKRYTNTQSPPPKPQLNNGHIQQINNREYNINVTSPPTEPSNNNNKTTENECIDNESLTNGSKAIRGNSINNSNNSNGVISYGHHSQINSNNNNNNNKYESIYQYYKELDNKSQNHQDFVKLHVVLSESITYNNTSSTLYDYTFNNKIRVVLEKFYCSVPEREFRDKITTIFNQYGKKLQMFDFLMGIKNVNFKDEMLFMKNDLSVLNMNRMKKITIVFTRMTGKEHIFEFLKQFQLEEIFLPLNNVNKCIIPLDKFLKLRNDGNYSHEDMLQRLWLLSDKFNKILKFYNINQYINLQLAYKNAIKEDNENKMSNINLNNNIEIQLNNILQDYEDYNPHFYRCKSCKDKLIQKLKDKQKQLDKLVEHGTGKIHSLRLGRADYY